MDFSLLRKKQSFRLGRYFSDIENELKFFGFHFEVTSKNKTKFSAVESAFIKGNTIENLMMIQVPSHLVINFPKNQTITIKFELDTDPPETANFEMKTLLTPIPFQARLYSLPDLFAGKLHAVLCRAWKTRVKGRDYYDMIWFLAIKIPCHLSHLKERMVQTGHWSSEEELTRNQLIALLIKRFSEVDFDAAAKDVRPFIKDRQELKLWNRDFFTQIVKEIEAFQTQPDKR